MSKLLASDHKAIAWFATENNLMPQLSVPPKMSFINRNTREHVDYDLLSITTRYIAWKKEETKARAAMRKAEKAQENKRYG